MRIALLNLTLDSNYGGNLQRYALVKVLQSMGHEVEHLSMHYVPHITSLGKVKWYIKRVVKKALIDHSLPLSWEQDYLQVDERRCQVAKPFYEKYIPHTAAIHEKKELDNYLEYDAYIVGSDQVWRPFMTWTYGVSTYFFDFLPSTSKARRIAYGVSTGVAENVFDDIQISELGEYYKRFNAASVRESSMLDLFNKYGWTSPKAQLVLDPTLLLERKDYEQIISENDTNPSGGSMFCYILDPTPEKTAEVKQIAEEKGLKPFFQIGCMSADSMSIPQWLRSFQDAEYIYTDSFHGLVFSLIFQKPSTVKFNKHRGNARFETLASTLHLNLQESNRDWHQIEKARSQEKKMSLDFLTDNL